MAVWESEVSPKFIHELPILQRGFESEMDSTSFEIKRHIQPMYVSIATVERIVRCGARA